MPSLARNVGIQAVRAAGVLVDLVLPTVCAGCAASGAGQLCPDCAGGLASLVPTATAPTPAPPGFPPCVALGAYEGPLRGLILAYKERGAHRLARPLGEHLARAIAGAGKPVVIIPVPSSAAAIRERRGDHMSRIARHTVRALRCSGVSAAVGGCLSARPKADSSHLSAAERLANAPDAFRVRASATRRVIEAQRSGARIMVIDDILTTGATVAAVAAVLAGGGLTIDGAATIAATRRQAISPIRVRPPDTRPDVGFSA